MIDFTDIKSKGFSGVMFRCTDGIDIVEESYTESRNESIKHGVHWGAYHVLRPGDVADQVHVFLNKSIRKVADKTKFPQCGVHFTDPRNGFWQAVYFLELLGQTSDNHGFLYIDRELKNRVMEINDRARKYPLIILDSDKIDTVAQKWYFVRPV